MRWTKLAMTTVIFSGLTFLGMSCEPSNNPAAVTTAIPSETAAPGTPAATATGAPTAIVTPIPSATSGPPGSMAALSQTLISSAQGMGAVAGGQVTAAQLQQVMDQLAVTARQVSQLALQAPQGTPGVRQSVAQTMDQLGALGAKLRDNSATLTAEQRKLALQQAQVLMYDMAQVTLQVQNMAAQAGPTEEQPIIGQLQQVQATIGYVLIQASLATPTPAPSVVPTVQATPSR